MALTTTEPVSHTFILPCWVLSLSLSGKTVISMLNSNLNQFCYLRHRHVVQLLGWAWVSALQYCEGSFQLCFWNELMCYFYHAIVRLCCMHLLQLLPKQLKDTYTLMRRFPKRSCTTKSCASSVRSSQEEKDTVLVKLAKIFLPPDFALSQCMMPISTNATPSTTCCTSSASASTTASETCHSAMAAALKPFQRAFSPWL